MGKDVVILGCSSQQPTRYRNHGAYLVRWNEEGLLFDPGEGTQRQFIFANVAPPVVTRIFISHFHGDHCLGLGSMLMRLNLDKVKHPIHCYYPGSHKKNFDRLRYGCVYHETINVVEHPVYEEGIVDKDENFIIEAYFLEHGIDNIGWRVTETDKIKFYKERLEDKKVFGKNVRKLEREKIIDIDGNFVKLEDVSFVKKGEVLAVVIDTRTCLAALKVAKDASLLICESTFLDSEKDLAKKYLHMTAKEAGFLAKKAHVKKLILTHFSARYTNVDDFQNEAAAVFKDVVVAEDFKVVPF